MIAATLSLVCRTIRGRSTFGGDSRLKNATGAVAPFYHLQSYFFDIEDSYATHMSYPV